MKCRKVPHHHPRSVRSSFRSWAKESRKGSTYAFCVKCSRDVLGGTLHEQTSLHGRASSNSMSLQSYFGGPTHAMAVIEAEVKFGYIPFLLADQLFQPMFPDSAIAKSFKCSCTKATAILKVIALDVLQQIRDVLSFLACKLPNQQIFQSRSRWCVSSIIQVDAFVVSSLLLKV